MSWIPNILQRWLMELLFFIVFSYYELTDVNFLDMFQLQLLILLMLKVSHLGAWQPLSF